VINVVLGLGCFFVGVVVGAILDDAYDQLRASRTERVLPKPRPRLPKMTTMQTLGLLLVTAAVANTVLGVLLISTRATAHRAEEQNRENAVTACLNGNESRAANLSLWNFVLELSAVSREEEPTPAEAKRLADFKAWVASLYAPRDCSDLSRKYPIPPPPDLRP